MRITFTVLVLVWAIVAGSAGCSSSSTEVGSNATVERESSALNWGSPVTVDTQKWGTNRDNSELEVVSGNPAVAYIVWNKKSSQYILYYKRASNATGTSWRGKATTVATMPATRGGINCYCSLAVVNGNPAIAFADMTGVGDPGRDGNDLRFVRANDATGGSWGQPVTVEGQGHASSGVEMEIVNGKPAIIFTHNDSTKQRGKYVRALDADGSTWGTPVIPDDTAHSAFTRSLAIVNGHPAISYFTYNPVSEVRYIRAADANGDSWGSPQTILSGVTRLSRLVVANNHPALVLSDSSIHGVSGVLYLRALDLDGAAWPADPLLLDGAGYTSSAFTSIINGKPAVAYVRGDSSAGPFTVNYIQALDADGSVWESSQTVAQVGDVSPQTSITEVAQGAGIAYHDATRAKIFIRGQ